MTLREDREVSMHLILLANADQYLNWQDLAEAIEAETGVVCGHQAVINAAHDIRRTLGDSETINLICDPLPNGEWGYKLVGNLDEARGWVTNRLGDSETRLRTMNSVSASYVRGTDGRTLEGRKARLIERTLRHLIEDMDALAEDVT